MLSFSRSARESPGWLLCSNDVVLPRPSVGDPRFARMTEEKGTLTRPLSPLPPLANVHRRTLPRTSPIARHSEGALATEESHRWLRQGNDKHFSKHAVILALRAGIPPLVATGERCRIALPLTGGFHGHCVASE